MHGLRRRWARGPAGPHLAQVLNDHFLMGTLVSVLVCQSSRRTPVKTQLRSRQSSAQKPWLRVKVGAPMRASRCQHRFGSCFLPGLTPGLPPLTHSKHIDSSLIFPMGCCLGAFALVSLPAWHTSPLDSYLVHSLTSFKALPNCPYFTRPSLATRCQVQPSPSLSILTRLWSVFPSGQGFFPVLLIALSLRTISRRCLIPIC